MAVMGSRWWSLSLRMIGGATLIVSLGIASMVAIAEARLRKQVLSVHGISPLIEPGLLMRVLNFLWQKDLYGYTHVWPVSPLLYFTSCFWDSDVGSSFIYMDIHILLLIKSS